MTAPHGTHNPRTRGPCLENPSTRALVRSKALRTCLIVPSFNGDPENGGDLGTSTRSYLRQVSAWEKMTKLAPDQRALVLYQHLSDGVERLREWIRQHYLDVEVTQVGRSLSDLFRKLRRRPQQSSMRRSLTGCWRGWSSAAALCQTWQMRGSSWTGPTLMRLRRLVFWLVSGTSML